MPFSNIDKKVRSKSLSKTLFAATALSATTLMVAAPAHAQFVPDTTITDCASFVNNPGTADAGIGIAIDIGGTCTVTNGDNIELENGQQDDVVIQVRSGTTLVNTDTSDEDTIFFQDNSENRLVVEIEDGAELRAENGAIFLEGDENRIVNRGTIIGTGAQEEGLIYVDRDTDGGDADGGNLRENIIINDVTGSILAQDGGPAIGVEVLLVDGNDDPENVGVQDPIEQFPFLRIVNRAGARIQAAINPDLEDDGSLVSDDSDGINIAGNPGTTGGFDRRCIEVVDGAGATVAPVTNCHINLTLINSGEIRTLDDNSGTAGITIEDDAIFNGRINNLAGGLIVGVRNGIRIGAVSENGFSAEHSGNIFNAGTINGNGDSGRGIDLEGSGVSITNRGTGIISGTQTGVEIGNGSSSDPIAENNVITNYGTITGGSFSVDSSAAEAAIRINSRGGTFNGDIRGSVGIQDTLSIQTGVTNLTSDVLGDFDVRVTPVGTLNFVGDRTIEGNLFSQGTLGFDLSNTQTVTGDLALRGNGASTVAITDASGVGAIGETFTLVSVGGTLTQNGAAIDTSLLLDFEFVDQGQDLAVEAVAAGSATSSAIVSDIAFASSNVEAFGESVLTAFADGGLNNTLAFSNLGSLETTGQLGTAIASLAPDFSGELVQNVFNTVQNGTAQIDHRLNDLECNQFAPTASLAGSEVEACHTLAETGHWVQTTHQNSTQGSLSLGGATYFNHGSDTDNVTFTYGYDQAVSDNTILGFSSSYSETEVDSETNSVASTELDVLQFSAYAGHRVGNAEFVTKASYSYGEAETSRQSFDVIRSEVDISGINAQSVASYNVNVGQGYYLKPEAGLHYNNITTSAFTESGGLNLNVDQVNTNVLDGRVGLTLGARKAISEETRADMFVTGAIRNDFYGDRDDIGFNFAGQSGSLAVASTDRFAVQGLAGVNVVSGKTFTFGAAVNSEFSNEQNSVGGSVQTKLRW